MRMYPGTANSLGDTSLLRRNKDTPAYENTVVRI
jgi:hypothetical protein